MRGVGGGHVRIEPASIALPIDRDRSAGLPDHPGPEVPLICLDTETTGLATGAGTLAFLVGLGWWDGDAFRQVQLLLPDQAGEAGFLEALAALLPPNGWLVTYNGRGFDWPLLVTRFRLNRRTPPSLAGHLDLLPFVRRVFRHRMSDARLKTVETELLGVRRGHDIEGWEIPGRYLEMLRGGPVEPIGEVVRHNHEDVRSLARLLAHAERHLGASADRRSAPAGDLFGLARAYRRLAATPTRSDCLDAALEGPTPAAQRRWVGAGRPVVVDDPDPASRRDRSGDDEPGPPRDDRRAGTPPAPARAPPRGPRGLARRGPCRRPGRGALAWIEVAKCLEHREHDPAGAMSACAAASGLAQRSRLLGRPLRAVEADLGRRRVRLSQRIRSPAVPGRPLT